MSHPYPPQPPPPGPDSYGNYQVNQPGQGLAIAALVTGIIGLLGLSIAWIPFIGMIVGIPALIAIVLGIIAMMQVSKGRARGKGMALAGLILGVLALIGTVVLQILLITLFARGVDQLESYTSSYSSSYSSSASATPSGSTTSGTAGGQGTSSGGAEVTLGEPTVSSVLATVEITVKNTTSKQASYTVNVEAVGSDGSVVGTGTGTAVALDPGESTESSALVFADEGKDLTGATFRVKSVDGMGLDLPSSVPTIPLPSAP